MRRFGKLFKFDQQPKHPMAGLILEALVMTIRRMSLIVLVITLAAFILIVPPAIVAEILGVPSNDVGKLVCVWIPMMTIGVGVFCHSWIEVKDRRARLNDRNGDN